MLFVDSCDVEHKGTIARYFNSSGLLRCWYSVSSSVLTSLVPSDKKLSQRVLLTKRSWVLGGTEDLKYKFLFKALYDFPGHPIIAPPSPSSFLFLFHACVWNTHHKTREKQRTVKKRKNNMAIVYCFLLMEGSNSSSRGDGMRVSAQCSLLSDAFSGSKQWRKDSWSTWLVSK